eukprot:COSAG02_NODE_18257_length_950_cov_2.033365_1_plen_22_part_10
MMDTNLEDSGPRNWYTRNLSRS